MCIRERHRVQPLVRLVWSPAIVVANELIRETSAARRLYLRLSDIERLTPYEEVALDAWWSTLSQESLKVLDEQRRLVRKFSARSVERRCVSIIAGSRRDRHSAGGAITESR
jgi:hypothetical protein